MRALALVAVMLCTGAAYADVVSSVRPVLRAVASEVSALPRPVSRPRPAVLTVAAVTSVRPALRPAAVEQRVMAQRRTRQLGAVCGDVDIQGQRIGAVTDPVPGCGVADAVRIREVAGVALSQHSVMDCGTAQALQTWVERSAKPTLRSTGGGLEELRVAAHYVCKTRNSRAGARISEHGKGKAIDISGFILADGREITVRQGWGQGRDGRLLRQMHNDACGPFGTVLGPEADRFHQGHFHLDTARYRSGPYCR